MRKLVIIGGVAAGLKAAAKARRCDPKAQITVVEKGEIISFAACGMPYFISGDVLDITNLMKTAAGMRDVSFFKNVKNITVLTKTLATLIDRESKSVKVKNLTSGEESALPYDKLVIATGASPLKPQLPGIELANIYHLWHPDDAKAIRRGLEEKQFKNAVIIGTGLIGMEMAESLVRWNLKVTAVEMKEQVFPAFLDAEIAGIVAKYIHEYLRTSDPDIYAGGDCVENVNIVSKEKVFAPMGSTANKHGRIIGENICDRYVKFRGISNTVVVRVMGLNIGKTGLSEQDVKQLGYQYVSTVTAGTDKAGFMPDAKMITVKLIVETKTRRVLGMQAVGEGDVAKRVDVLATALNFNGTIEDLFDIDLSYAPPYNSPIDRVAVAANTVMNQLTDKYKGISSLKAKEMMSDDKVVFLDVRNPLEYQEIKLARSKNIRHLSL
jgi:NADPH-dependent 2,4-dienoyl-CoA reductase/sulfur reductase-like enzyme